MPAAVESGQRVVDYWGRTAVEMVNVTWNNNDTFTSEYGSILGADFAPTTNASFGITVSGKVATLVSGGSLTGWLQVYSDGT
jgi:hypothetical protein